MLSIRKTCGYPNIIPGKGICISVAAPRSILNLNLLNWAIDHCSKVPSFALSKYTNALLSISRRNSVPVKVNFSVTAQTTTSSSSLKEL